MYNRRFARRRKHFISPTCPTHKGVALKLGQCPECCKIQAAERLAKIKAQPDVREYVNWDKKVSWWSPSFQPLYMILLDKVPKYTNEDGYETVFGFGNSALAGSHGRTVEEVRGYVRDMLTKYPKFNWSDINIKIVNAPCVWDASIVHEVVEEVRS